MTSLSIFDKKTKSSNHYKKLFCKNCGKYGHIHRYCSEPRTSLGIILYRTTPSGQRQYLMIRRKNSIGYVQFVRGKYCEQDTEYIQKLFDEMSVQEKHIVRTVDFSKLWQKLWSNSLIKNREQDFSSAEAKFQRIHVDKYIDQSQSKWLETEWGFPKGRRDLKETNMEAARREFREETNIAVSLLRLVSSTPFIELYRGSDNIFYKHIYFLHELDPQCSLTPTLGAMNTFQMSEISDIGFYTLDECVDKIRDYHQSKIQVLQKVDNYIECLRDFEDHSSSSTTSASASASSSSASSSSFSYMSASPQS